MSSLLTVAPLLGLIAMVMSLWHLVPLAVSVGLNDGAGQEFATSMAINSAAGYLLWLATRRFREDLKPRDGITLVVFAWVGGAAFAAVPLLLTIPDLSVTDAYFEAVAGLTASGGTVLSGLDRLPPSVNVWRGELQWLGGLGILVLAVAILPLLGLGGRQIYRAEMPGPMKDSRLTPRIKETAKVLWTVYVVLTLLCQWRPEWLVHGFTREPAVVEVATRFLRLISWNFAASGLIFTCSGIFQGLGHTWPGGGDAPPPAVNMN